MNITFKQFDCNTELPAQRKMFTLCFPETVGKSSEKTEHYKWKFHSFPNTPTSYEYVAYEDNQMLGYYAALPYQYKIDNEILTAGMVCDVMTHPNARGKGIFTKIGHYATDHMRDVGVHFTTGYPIRPEVIPGHMKVGWKAPFELPMYLRPLKSNDILKSNKLGFLSPLVNIAMSLYNFTIDVFSSVDKKIEHRTLSVNELLKEERYHEFIQSWNSLQKYYLIKDKEFLRWRLGSQPDDYRIICSFQDDKMVAMAIVKKTVLNDINSLAILDLMVDTNKLKASASLISYIKKYASRSRCEVIVLMISRHWAKRYQLLKNGFLKTPFSFTFITKALNVRITPEDFFNEKQWHLTWIDSDDL